MPPKIKICGIQDAHTMHLLDTLGVQFAGLVFYPKSPRALTIEGAASLSRLCPQVQKVGLFVNPDDAMLEGHLGEVHLDMLQLHGDETPTRMAEIKARFDKPVMKAMRIGNANDLSAIAEYEAICDWLLLDSKKPSLPSGGRLDGGNQNESEGHNNSRFASMSTPHPNPPPEGGRELLRGRKPLPHQIEFARRLRKNMTDSEKKLWYAINRKQLGGYKFRKQHPIENYITDFACLEEKLIIEVDGGQHAENPEDQKRNQILQNAGFTILRFWNHDIMQNLDGVLQTILHALKTKDLPGGTGHKFDWSLLKGQKFEKPWMLAGGLTPSLIPDALRQLSPNALDVSSGVESAPGIKDHDKIKTFVEAVLIS